MKKASVIILIFACAAGFCQVPAVDSTRPRVLDTAIVSVQRALITQRIDGFIYDAKRDIPVAGETASDILRKLPGVMVDRDGAPAIRGSARIRVFIDGKPSETYASSITDALRQIPADIIDRIEIITHPSARYEAEGTDGVINIFTKKQLEDGSSGSINGRVANRSRLLSGNLAVRKHHLILNAGGGSDEYSNESKSTLNRADPPKPDGTYLWQRRTGDSKTTNWNGNINLTYLADSLTTVNVSYSYGKRNDLSNSIIDNSISAQDVVKDRFARTIDNPSGVYIHSMNWGLVTHSRDKSAEYNFMGTWFYQGLESNYLLNQVRGGQTDYAETNRNTIANREIALQADLTKNFGDKVILESGLLSAFRKFSNKSLFDVFDLQKGVYIPDEIRANDFYFHRAILAAYMTYTIKLKDWKLRAGARYEQTHWPLHFRDTSFATPDYRNFLPDLIISKSFAAVHTLSAGYSRKLFRPNFVYLNPIVNYIDSLNPEHGNPGLQPVIGNNYDITYTYHKDKWLVSASFFINLSRDNIERIRILKAGGVIDNTYANISDYSITGCVLNVSFQAKRFTFNMNSTLRHLVFRSKELFPDKDGLAANGSLNLSYKPSPTFAINAFVNLNTKAVNLQGYRTGWKSYTLTMNKDIPRSKLSISLRIDNLFSPYQYITEETAADAFSQEIENRYINRFFKLGLTYKFGKKEIRSPVTKTISDEN